MEEAAQPRIVIEQARGCVAGGEVKEDVSATMMNTKKDGRCRIAWTYIRWSEIEDHSDLQAQVGMHTCLAFLSNRCACMAISPQLFPPTSLPVHVQFTAYSDSANGTHRIPNDINIPGTNICIRTRCLGPQNRDVRAAQALSACKIECSAPAAGGRRSSARPSNRA
ncbi:hypothetical protein DENSPDRAFT_839379 [Dentipellis sp. KUC8613]|nr:hypothetical protein DENSPDRAFT_839379 [Dentipellis sp. KUC8613]